VRGELLRIVKQSAPVGTQSDALGCHDPTRYAIRCRCSDIEEFGACLARKSEHTYHCSPNYLPVLTRQMGRALSAIHREKMVHRDVTPGNIFLSRFDGAEETMHAKLLDFGIAKAEDDAATTTTSGAILGSPSYMSPEQARAEPVSAQSDLWSFGAVLFRALTGRDVFVGSNATDVLIAVCTAPLPSVGEFVPELGADVDRFFQRAFARNRSHRNRLPVHSRERAHTEHSLALQPETWTEMPMQLDERTDYLVRPHPRVLQEGSEIAEVSFGCG